MENKKIKILAIDDNRDNLITLKAILSEALPHSMVYLEESGQSGIESAKKNEPDVILLDIVMPEMDGYQVCKILKADEQMSDIPIIFLTALKGNKQSRILALEAGGEAFLAKPIDPTELQAQINAMLKINAAAAYKRNEKLRLEELVQNRTDELKKANIATLNILEDLQEENQRRKKSEAALRESEKKYAFLARTAFDLVEITSIQKIYEYTARKLYELLEENGVVAIVDFDSDTNRWKMQQIEGIQSKLDELVKFIGFDVRKLEGDINKRYLDSLNSKKLVEVEYDLKDFLNINVSDIVGKSIKNLLSIDKIHCILIQDHEKTIGNITVVTKKNSKPLNAELIEAFVLQVENIIKKQKTEEKLKLLNRAVEASSLSVIITDVNGVIDYINPHFSKVTGYSSEEVLGKNPKILKSNHHPKSFYKNLWDTVLSGKEWTGVILNKKKNGELYWEKAIVSPILDSNGKVINFVAIKEDITEKKRFEDTQKFLLEISVLATKQITATAFLAEVHQKLKKIIRSDNFYVALFNEADQTFSFPYHVDDYDSIEMNKPYDLRNSYTNHVLKTGQALIVTAQEQDEVKGNNRISAYSNQSSVWLGVPFKTKEGDKSNGVIAIQDYRNTEPYTETDKTIMEIIAHSIGSFIERIKYIEELVQARKNAEESEDKLRNLSEMQSIILRIASAYINMPQELVEDSINNSLKELGEFVQADRAYIFDYNWTRNVCNNTYEWCNEGINPEIDNLQNVPNEVIDYWVEAHKNGREMNIEDVMQLPPDDGVRQILETQGVKSVLALPMMKRDKCIGFIGFDSVRKIHKYSEKEKTLVKIFSEMLVNIGNRIEIEKNLVQAKEKAEESDKLKTAFINNISHEIRTPLNGILGFGQILADPDLTTEEHEKFFKHIKKSSLRLMNTVTDYMDMAMLVSQTMEVNKKDIALEAVFGLIVEEARQLCEDKNLRFTLEIPKNAADLILHSDPELIQKIIKELIDNAIKFTDEGSIISGCDIKSDHIAFFVKDTGRGIDEDKRDLIFELFSQADTEMTRGYEGSGLGLSIAKGLVTLLGGKIQVQSEKGKGTVFTFTIPFKNQVKPTAPNKKTTPKTPDTKHPLILIAEDEESNLDYLTIVLERFGYRHLHAVNGQEAVDYCRQNPDISLVLMDIKMPVMHGDEATRQIRSFRPELPIIATTAHAQTGDEQRFLNAGCNDYVSKPIKKDSLLAIIRKYTG